MTQVKKAKKGKFPAKKPGAGSNAARNQLLISRFFSAKPKADATPPSKPKKSTQANVEKDEPVKPLQKAPVSEPEVHDHEPEKNEPDTPATQVLTTPHGRDSDLSSQSPEPVKQATKEPDSASGPRKRRRLFVRVDDDDDEESASEAEKEAPLKKTKNNSAKKSNDDPDFAIGDAQSDDEQDGDGESVVDSDEEMAARDVEDDEDGEGTARKRREDSEGGTTLESYCLDRTTGELAAALPRDAKRRKRFTQKIGRLEKNSFFLRRTGGGGDAVEPRNEKKGVPKTSKYTPLELQYVNFHKRHPDLLLVVECGYKYRMFDEDASTASKVLRVASFFDHNFLTASFPTHRLGHHVRRLVQAGYKVGVISQTETAALKKASDKSSKLFQRKLTAVYSKGTIAADGKLWSLDQGNGASSRSASYILALLELDKDPDGEKASQTQEIAIAAVDSATGEVLFDSFADDGLRSDLESRLVALEPVEVLMSKDTYSKQTELVMKAYCETTSCRLERMKKSCFAQSESLSELNKTVESKYQEERVAMDAVLACLGALASYLKEFGLELSMSQAIEFKSFRSSREMKIGADVLRSFEVFGNSNSGSVEGSLFGLMNRTKTPFGSRQMRQWISHPLVNASDIASRLDAVEYLRSKVEGFESSMGEDLLDNAVIELTKFLADLPDLEQGLTRISCQKCTPSEFLAVIKAFEQVGARIDHLKALEDVFKLPKLLGRLLSSTPVVGDVLNGNIVESLNRSAAANDLHHELFMSDRAIADFFAEEDQAEEFLNLAQELEGANADLVSCEKEMDSLLKKLRNAHSCPRWEWKKVANEEYLLEVPVSKASSMPRSWPIICQTKAVKRFRPPEADRGFEKVLCARETRDAVAANCWKSYLELFASVAAPLRAVVRTLVDWDCLAALARVSNLPGYAKPEIDCSNNNPSGLEARDARHPLTETLQSCTSYVPNDVNLGRGAHEIALVISGPNYGGKSSYARMTALLVIMAQIGSYLPVGKAKLSPFDSIFARMGSSDSIAKGMSSLMVELSETSRILSLASDRSLVILDELGRGTSTHDGTAIAYSTLSYLVGSLRCVSLFVTHYPMLATLRNIYPDLVGAYYMDYLEEKVSSEGSIDDGDGQDRSTKTKITFLYKLAKGVASSSYGLNVARLAGIPTTVIYHAGEKAVELEKTLRDARTAFSVDNYLREERWQNEETAFQILKAAHAVDM